MKATEAAARITGFSTPFFGVSWVSPQADVEVARRLIAFLEDRRVLYAPYEVEVPEECIASVMSIRDYMTGLIGSGGIKSELVDSLRAIRAAARKFCTRWAANRGGHVFPARTDYGVDHMHDRGFNQALGELRGVIGVQVALVAARYQLDVEDELASIMPAPDEE